VEEKRKKKMKNRMWTMAGALALLAVVGKFYALPAIAQTVRAALVKNIDERGRNPFVYGFSCSPTPGSPGYCVATGAPIPAGTRLVVENINIFGSYASTASVVRTALGVNTALTRVHDVTGGTVSDQGNGQSSYSLNANLIDYIEAGESPSLLFEMKGSTAGALFFGAITGYLVNLNN
jgi:hypothetical protein